MTHKPPEAAGQDRQGTNLQEGERDMSIDWDKPIQTKSGHPARLVGTFNGYQETHIVVATYEDGREECWDCFEDGRYSKYTQSDNDLRNVPETRTAPEHWMCWTGVKWISFPKQPNARTVSILKIELIEHHPAREYTVGEGLQ